MKKSVFIIVLSVFILTGCLKSDAEPVTEPVTEPEPVGVEVLISPEEASAMAKDYIMGMREYSENNGYHLEEIDTKPALCPGCYEVSYEFRIREQESADIIGTADVTITITDGEVTKVMYWDDVEGEEKSLPVQDSPMIGGQRDEHGCLGPAGYQWCEVNQKCQRFWEEPCIEDPEFNEDVVKQAFLEKYPEWGKYNMEIRISKQVGDHALGGSVPSDMNAGGGYWFAAKTADGWVIAADGNGNIFCSEIEPYDFPSDMIPQCWDDVSMTEVER